MAIVAPFKGLRFNEDKAGHLAQLITPPYDIISEEQQDIYYKKNPYNIIRLEYGKTFEDDDSTNNRYVRAAKYLNSWRNEGILVRDKQPSIYLCQHEFEINSTKMIRWGFTCNVKLEPYERGVILPHEETLPRHKADRLELMRACQANFSPIFGLYTDKELQIDKLLQSEASGNAPDIEIMDEEGHTHRMWLIKNKEVISQLQKKMFDQRILIADGHHRYETALTYKNELRAREKISSGEEKPYDYVMMNLVNLYDPGLLILPTHRLVKYNGNFSEILVRMQKEFYIEKLELEQYYTNPQEIQNTLWSKAELDSQMDQQEHKHLYAIYSGQKLYLLTLKNKNLLNSLPQGRSVFWNQLDVAVLQSMILEKYLDIGFEEVASGDYLKYTRDNAEVFKEVDNGNYQIGIFINPTLIEEVILVASQGEKMPQKSTYFYPKLITGLVINDLT